MDITINGNINFNGDNNFSNNTLLDNETTFNELIGWLKQNLALKETNTTGEGERPLVRETRRPGAVQLRTHFSRIAMIPVGDGCCEVFSNGYAVFDNGDRKTVIWVPACSTRTYRFTRLTDRELEYQHEEESLDEETIGEMLWYYPIIMAGEDRIEQNLVHLKSAGNMSDIESVEDSPGEICFCNYGKTFPNPEDACIQKEQDEERRAMLTDKRYEIYEMFFIDRLTQREIARRLGISQKAVNDRLKGIEKKMRILF